MPRWKPFVFLGIFAIILMTAGCGSGSANLRLINALPSQASVNFLVDGNSVATGIGYGAASSYVSVSSGSRHIQAEVSGSTNMVLDLTQSLGSNSYSTALAAPTGSIVLTDNHSTPSSGNFSIRVVNASANLSMADVYVLGSGATVFTTNPTYSGLTIQSTPTYMALPAGTYQIVFTIHNSQTQVTSTSSLTFTSGQVRTVLLLDGFGVGGETTSVIADLN